MEDYVRTDTAVALRLPSGLHKLIQLKPNTTVSLGKYGSFSADDLIGRPFFLTYEIVDLGSKEKKTSLRVVSAAELYAQDEVPEADLSGEQPDRNEGTDNEDGQYEIVDQTGKVLMRTNQNILDNNAAQKLTMAEIEQLKQAESASGRDIIAKIMESHAELDKKTAFSLAKYTTRKANKYLRRFVPIPMDVPFLARWYLYEKESMKIMEVREEMLSLIASWSNVHHIDTSLSLHSERSEPMSTGRWLVVDDTGGLIVALVAEKLGILHSETCKNLSPDTRPREGKIPGVGSRVARPEENTPGEDKSQVSVVNHENPQEDMPQSSPRSTAQGAILSPNDVSGVQNGINATPRPVPAAVLAQESHMSATDNTITVVHTNNQPNLALLAHFNYDPNNSDASHPLHRHLKSLSWLQLLHPEEDPTYVEPDFVEKRELDTWKSAKRGTYYRKRRRWERVKGVIDQTRSGGFDGLIIASTMAPAGILHHLAPLLRGGASVVVYSPNIEPLTELADFYSAARRTAFLNAETAPDDLPTEDFPVNPTLLLGGNVYTARIRPWQVLPGRTHPIMTAIGGPEGYIFTATRVFPIEGEKVEARGSYKRRKTASKAESTAAAQKKENVEREGP